MRKADDFFCDWRIKVKSSNSILQKLSNDVEKAQQERTDLEKQMIHKSQESPEPGHSDHDWRIMESRLKVRKNFTEELVGPNLQRTKYFNIALVL